MAAKRRAFIIRIWQTEDGGVVGQISNPQNGWRRPFRNADELWHMLVAEEAQSPPGESSHYHSASPADSEEEEQS